MSTPTVSLSLLQDGKPLLYHQHALARIFSDQNKKLPTQIVFPDESMSLGLPPTSLTSTFRPNQPNEAETEDDVLNRLRAGPLVVYASATPASEMSSELNRSAFAAFFFMVLQSLLITLTFLGFSFIDIVGDQNGPHASQKWIYTFIVASYCFPCLGILYRLPILMSAQSSLSLALLILGLLSAFYSVLDLVILLLSLCTRRYVKQMGYLMSSQVFSILPEL